MIMPPSQGFGLQCYASLAFEVFRLVKTSRRGVLRIVSQSVLKNDEVGSKSVRLYCNILIQTFAGTSPSDSSINDAENDYFQKVARPVKSHVQRSPATAYPKLFNFGKNSKTIPFLGQSKSTPIALDFMMFTCCSCGQ